MIMLASESMPMMTEPVKAGSGAASAGLLVARFEERARQTPDAVAVVCGNQSITYGELNGAANTVAWRLGHLGCRRGDFIGLGFERSLAMTVALWGVIKAGCAYVPLDPAYPAARLAHMIRSAGLKLVLSQGGLMDVYRQAGAGEVHDVDALHGKGPGAMENPPVAAGPDDFLYAIFTSGSTGQPKAATVFHRGFANLARWYEQAFGLDATARVLLMSSLSFDLTQKNLFAPLLAGGQLILLPPGTV